MSSIYLKPVWSKEDLINAQRNNQLFLDDFCSLLASKYSISKEYLEYLGNEDLTIAHSILLDAQKRISLFKDVKGEIPNINPLEFFSNFQNVSINNDLSYRNEILSFFAAMEGKLITDLDQSELIKTSLQEYISKYKFKIGEEKASIDFEKLKDFFQVLIAQLLSFQGTSKLVHYINLDLRKFSQLRGFQYKKIIPPPVDLTWAPTDKEKVYQDLKDDFLNLESLNHFNLNQKSLLLLVILNSTKPWLYKPELIDDYINSCREFIREENINTLVNQGNFFRDTNKLFFLALLEEEAELYEYQNGGFPIYDEGYHAIQNRFILPRKYLTWAPIHPLPDHIKTIKTPNPRLKTLSNKAPRIESKPFQILYTPIALSHICNIEIFNSFLPEHMNTHRLRVHQILSQIKNQNIELNVKLKAFGNTLFKGYEFLTVPLLHGLNIETKFLLTGTSSEYFSKFHLHFTDGMSTTFSESLSHNMPTIGFWNEDVLHPHHYLKDIFQELRKQKILITNSNEFSSALNRHINAPGHWESREIQEVISEYKRALAYHSPQWKAEIKGILK